MKKVVLAFFIGIIFVGTIQAQFEIPDTPVKQTSLYDYIGLLTDSGARFLEEKLVNYSNTTSNQVVIIIIESTNGDNIQKLAMNWGNKWGIGQKVKDNGIVLLMAKSDRKVAISTGRGVEMRLTNSIAKQIIESRIIPEFKKGNYYKGLSRGADGIIECLNGSFTETKKEAKEIGDYNDDNWWQGKIFERILAFLFFTIVIIAFIFGKSKNGTGNDDDYWDSDRDTGWDFSDSSDGFDGGFGGGSFGGGGASGSW